MAVPAGLFASQLNRNGEHRGERFRRSCILSHTSMSENCGRDDYRSSSHCGRSFAAKKDSSEKGSHQLSKDELYSFEVGAS